MAASGLIMFAFELRAFSALRGKFKPAFQTLGKPVWRYFLGGVQGIKGRPL